MCGYDFCDFIQHTDEILINIFVYLTKFYYLPKI